MPRWQRWRWTSAMNRKRRSPGPSSDWSESRLPCGAGSRRCGSGLYLLKGFDNDLPSRAIVTALRILFIGIGCCVASLAPTQTSPSKTLDIYFIDVEGGQSTLVVTPDRHTLLIDAGWAGDGSGFAPGDPHKARDANRIVAAVRDAGVKQIDYLLITHFHTDHDGGVSELAKLMPIRAFIDHGAPHPN